jgi:hypothetical protein
MWTDSRFDGVRFHPKFQLGGYNCQRLAQNPDFSEFTPETISSRK